jgi:uncharacterized protein YndB with AHSA1/START domain
MTHFTHTTPTLMEEPVSDDKKQQVSGSIPASPEAVFALLSDPARHSELDGAGMVQGLASGTSPITAVGDAFVMDMVQEGIGTYQMRSEVTAFEPGRAIAWAPAIHPVGALSHVIGGMDPSGHIWGWDLAPAADGGTDVTHTYDWSGVKDEEALGLYPRVSTEQMHGSIAKIADTLT